MRPFDTNGEFRPLTEHGALRRLAVRGAGVTVLSGGLGTAVQIVATVVLARLLVPADFGVVAMVTTFSLILMNVGLNGFTEAVVQREIVDRHLVSNLFWINVGIGLLLSLGFAAAGSLLARFYHDPRVALVAVGISPTILINSTSVQHLALLKRAMRFTETSANEVVARVVSVCVSILLALAGWGYWALVAGVVALPCATTIGAWMLCRWIPSLPRRVDGTGSMVRFAINVYSRFGVNYFARNVDKLLVGWQFGASPLGFYKKAYDLFMLPASLLVSRLAIVAVSALSRLTQEPARYRRHLVSSLSVLAFVGMGLGADLTLVGNDLIRLLLGPGWEESGRIFSVFGLGIGIMLLYSTHGWIHLSVGRPDRWFRWGLVEVAVTGLLFLLALPWGPIGIAAAWTLSFWILVIPAFWYAGRPIQLDVRAVFGAVGKYLLASGIAGIAAAAIVRGLPPLVSASGALEAFLRVLLDSTIFGTLYLAAVVFLHRGYEPLRQIVSLLKEVVPGQPCSELPRETSGDDPVPVGEAAGRIEN